MLAVLGGLGAALCWATTTMTAAHASRIVGPQRVLAWVMLTGFVVVVPLVAIAGLPDDVGSRQVVWLTISGAGNVGGLLLVYAAVRVGKVSIVSPITSTEGAITAVLAVAAGEQLGAPTAVLLAVIVAGVVLASRGEDADQPGAHTVRASLLAGGAACAFGVSLFATARVSQSLPIAWAMLPPRLLGVALVTLPLLARRGLGIARPAVPFVVVSGLGEVAGIACYALGSRHGIAVTAVLGSQFAAIVVVASYFLFHERLRTPQVAGIVTVAVAVAVLTAVRA